MVEVPTLEGGGFVFFLDRFRYSAGEGQIADECHVPTAPIPDARLCPGEPAPGRQTSYLCVPSGDPEVSCDDCDVDCVRSRVREAVAETQQCLPYPRQLLCGPNPEVTDECCYVTIADMEDLCPD